MRGLVGSGVSIAMALTGCAYRQPQLDQITTGMIAQCGAGLRYSDGFTAGIEKRFGGKALTVGVQSEIRAAFLGAFSKQEAARQYQPYLDCITNKRSVAATIEAIHSRLDRMRFELREQGVLSAEIGKLVTMASQEQELLSKGNTLAARDVRNDITRRIVDGVLKAKGNLSQVSFVYSEESSTSKDLGRVGASKEDMERSTKSAKEVCSIMGLSSDCSTYFAKKEQEDLISRVACVNGVNPEQINQRLEDAQNDQEGTCN